MISVSEKATSRNIKLVLFISISIVTYLFFSHDIFANTQVCYPDCDSTFWVPNPPAPALSYTIILPCGEPVIVYYRTRYSCNEYYDLFIESLKFENGDGAGAHCGESMTTSEIVNNAVEQMLIQNPMNFPPTNPAKDTCVERYRVSMSPCWHSSFPVAKNTSSLSAMSSSVSQSGALAESVDESTGFVTPCKNLRCCLQAYRVCFVGGEKVITFKPAESTPGECDPAYGFDCYPVCN